MDYDIIIIGAGIVGLSLALSLAKNNCRIAIVDKNSDLTPKNDLQQRAISFANYQFLMAVGVDRHLFSAPYDKMEVWDASNDNSRLYFYGQETGLPVLGYIVDAEKLQYQLYQLTQQANIDYLGQAVLKRRYYDGRRNYLLLADGKRLSSSMVVGCDGAQSLLRQQANICWYSRAYDQRALVANVVMEKPHQKTARQRFLVDGPLAFLPLADPYKCSIVWTNSSDGMRALCQLDESEFKRQLADALQHQLGLVESVSQRLSFPLTIGHSQHYVQSGLALAGDAAHVIHPMAGLGLNLGLSDVKLLSTQLRQKISYRCLGDLWSLRCYERQRRHYNTKALLFVDQLNKLFCNNRPLLKYFRSLGLRSVNRYDFMKRYFVNQAVS